MVRKTQSKPDEVEVTPEMIEAGVSEMAKFDEHFEGFEQGVVKIFNAMIRAKKAS